VTEITFANDTRHFQNRKKKEDEIVPSKLREPRQANFSVSKA
jgi:hypothetical protein